MKVLVVDNVLLYKDENGTYYSPSIYDDNFFKRFTDVYSETYFCAKVNKSYNFDKNKFIKIESKKITIVELPWYRGIKGFFKNYYKMKSIIKKQMNKVDLAILRVIQLESIVAFQVSNNIPFLIEIVNNPKENFKGIKKIVTTFYIKKMIKKSIGVSYITRSVLQDLYPAKNKITASYLTNDIDEELLFSPKTFSKIEYPFKLVHVSNNIEDNSKGHMTVLKTIKFLNDKGYDVSCTFIGDGSKVDFFRNMAEDFGIIDKIVFSGRISDKKDMIFELRKHDLFIFPSYSEGLGRVNLEAQLSGLPILSSRVGGIIELLNSDYLFEPNDYVSYSEKIINLINNPDKLEQMSLENHYNVKKYLGKENYLKRENFYKKINKKVKGDKNEFI